MRPVQPAPAAKKMSSITAAKVKEREEKQQMKDRKYFFLLETISAENFVRKYEIQNPNFAQKSKFWSKIEIWVKNRNLGQK